MEWTWWDIALLAAAAYVAVISLVRLMRDDAISCSMI